MQLREAIKNKLAENFKAFKVNTDPGEDEYFILNARKRRRLAEAARRREQKKGRKAWTRRQMARQQITGDLAYQFAILDGGEPASPATQQRVVDSLHKKAQAVIDAQGCDWDAALDQLRALAESAPEPSRPKVRTYAEGGVIPSGRSWITNRTGLPEPVSYLGRGA